MEGIHCIDEFARGAAIEGGQMRAMTMIVKKDLEDVRMESASASTSASHSHQNIC